MFLTLGNVILMYQNDPSTSAGAIIWHYCGARALSNKRAQIIGDVQLHQATRMSVRDTITYDCRMYTPGQCWCKYVERDVARA